MELVYISSYYSYEEIQMIYLVHILVAGVIIFLALYYKEKILEYKEISIFFIIFAIFYFFIMIERTIIVPSEDINEAFKNKTYKVLEGKIEKLKPMPKAGHVQETFEVNGVKFNMNYGNEPGDNTFFFNLTKYYGSPIQKNGQYVKIYYLEDKPAKICLFFLPKCLEIKEPRGIIKLWVQKSE